MDKKDKAGIAGAGATQTAVEIENTQYTQYKKPKFGHGYAAEDANALNDKLKGKKVDKTGYKNTLNGADRIVDGKMIQTKYYNTAEKSVDAAFDEITGKYRYDGQLLEVPKDQYADAVARMEKKIAEGKVPGCTDPKKADEIVKQGDVTYKQAVNIAKAGNIDSLWFDVKTHSVVSGYAFGISFIISYATAIWHGLEPNKALQAAFGSALKTGTIVLISGVSTQQLLRTSFGRSLGAFTTKVSRQLVSNIYTTKVGKELIEQTASSIMNRALHGAAAQNVISKILRSNFITSTITGVVLTIPDAYNVIITRNISYVQFIKNLAVTAAGIGGGLAGSAAGAAVGARIADEADLNSNTAAGVGGLVGGLILGLAASIVTKKLADMVVSDDAQIMISSLNTAISELAYEYMLTESELDIILAKVQNRVDEKWLRQMYQYSGDRKNVTGQKDYVRQHFEADFDKVLKNRAEINTPNFSEVKHLALETREKIISDYSFYSKKIGREALKEKAEAVNVSITEMKDPSTIVTEYFRNPANSANLLKALQ